MDGIEQYMNSHLSLVTHHPHFRTALYIRIISRKIWYIDNMHITPAGCAGKFNVILCRRLDTRKSHSPSYFIMFEFAVRVKYALTINGCVIRVLCHSVFEYINGTWPAPYAVIVIFLLPFFFRLLRVCNRLRFECIIIICTKHVLCIHWLSTTKPYENALRNVFTFLTTRRLTFQCILRDMVLCILLDLVLEFFQPRRMHPDRSHRMQTIWWISLIHRQHTHRPGNEFRFWLDQISRCQ